MDFETKAIHIGLNQENKFGSATSVPLYQTAAFSFNTAEELQEVFEGKRFGYVYTRISNPTITAFELRINSLEEGIGAIATASGMAAIASVIFALTEQGDEIISSESLFGGTYLFFNEVVSKYGVKINYVDLNNIDSLKKLINNKTRLIFLESISNPKLEIPNLKLISNVAKEHNIPVVVDNTLTTPYLWCSKYFGADIIVHSATKYITGNGTAIGGVLIDTGNYNWKDSSVNKIKEQSKKTGNLAFLSVVRSKIYQNIGFSPSPFNVFLHLLGLETLHLRMEKHCSNALALSEYLKNHKKVVDVNYPGLKGNKFHLVGKEQFNNKFSGLLTFSLESKQACFNFINNLKLVKNLANLGDTRTLVIHPDSTIYINCTQEEKKSAGVSDNMIRVSVGLESINDIIEDFSQSLEKI
ncbi:O-acetylhomoserine aminocarboxypropyltransferase/cysteine synthase family protein [Melioribacteraceae bacterium 4301-Me]|uniref:O-acetylhomoserine aminocarboxypropyltransferase/cysteine synthase family protein n=1 Tax=Pyranulibacter aquaticus TaxID=3163344 RepID=UPI00359938C9